MSRSLRAGNKSVPHPLPLPSPLVKHANGTPVRRRRRGLAFLRRASGAAPPIKPVCCCSDSVFQVLRLQYQREVSQSHVTVQTKFNYAWGLIKSPKREHQVEGVGLLQGTPPPLVILLRTQLTVLPDIYRNEPVRRRECLYYLALGYYKMGNYEEAKSFVGVCARVPRLFDVLM